MSLSLYIAPICEPVTVSDIELQCRTGVGELAAESVLVSGYISAVRQKAEVALRRALITQTWGMTLDAFPCSTVRNPFAALEIPLPPLQSVTSVKYLSVDNVLTTLDPSLYVVDSATPGRIIPAYGQTWPATLDYPSAVQVRFVAGYGAPVAWDALAVYAIDARVLYTNGLTYRKTATTAAGIVCTDATKWALDHPGFAVPQCVRNWMMLNVANLYENRESESVSDSRMSQIDLTTMADSLLDSERWEVRV